MLKRFVAAFALGIVAFAAGVLLPLGLSHYAVAESCDSHACCQGPFMGEGWPCGGGHQFWKSYNHWTSTSHGCCLGYTIVCGDCNNSLPGGPDPITPE